jgi:hypothetical protein
MFGQGQIIRSILYHGSIYQARIISRCCWNPLFHLDINCQKLTGYADRHHVTGLTVVALSSWWIPNVTLNERGEKDYGETRPPGIALLLSLSVI